MESKSSTDNLKPQLIDHSVAAARGVANLVPIVGPILAEVIGVIIPQQRIDRVADFADQLDHRLRSLEDDRLESQLQNEEVTDLIEEGFRQATHSLSDERRGYIASLIANSLALDRITYSESRHILRLLDEINDLEVIWLRFHSEPLLYGDEEFRETHKEVLTPVRAHLGSSRDVIDKETLQDSYKEHLAQLGLLERRYRTDFRTRQPEFDKMTGAMEVSDYELSGLGSILLREIGLGREDEVE